MSSRFFLLNVTLKFYLSQLTLTFLSLFICNLHALSQVIGMMAFLLQVELKLGNELVLLIILDVEQVEVLFEFSQLLL